MIAVAVNGLPRQLAPSTPLAEILHDAPPRGIAVAVNGEVVPRSSWQTRELSDGDSVEILTAAQGG